MAIRYWEGPAITIERGEGETRIMLYRRALHGVVETRATGKMAAYDWLPLGAGAVEDYKHRLQTRLAEQMATKGGRW